MLLERTQIAQTTVEFVPWVHFYKHSLALISACISNYIQYKVWNEMNYSFINLNGATIEV